ncbi:MAG: peptide MFS transporter [Steroidobacteraceae bacterium]
MADSMSTTVVAGESGRSFFGHPRGLATLFFTEMWERFTYYGMRAILVLFLVATIEEGGLGIDDRTGNAIYGLYISGTYLLSLAGGWIADRLTGAQRAVWWGGIFIMAGNALLATGSTQLFFLGLMLIVCGVGLLKPNISAIVAQLYPEGGSRRDAGFSIFYMGINVGAFLGSTIVPILAARYGWRMGFAAPAIGMLLGLVQFALTRHYLGHAGVEPGISHPDPAATRRAWWIVAAVVAVLFIVVGLAIGGRIRIDPVRLLDRSFWAISAFAAGYFAYMLFFAGLDAVERKRVLVMIALFIACAMFWAGFEQAGSSLNIFADRHTDRQIGGWLMPAGVLQNINPLFIIIFAPVFAALWIALGKRNLDPSAPVKFALGLILMGCGFVVMYFAAQYVVAGEKVLPTWLILTYLFHTFGELCLSPVGLSSMSKLAPARFVGQALGVWFLATAIGNNLAGQFAGEFDPDNIAAMPHQFLGIFWWGAIGGAVLLLISPYAKRLMGGVK